MQASRDPVQGVPKRVPQGVPPGIPPGPYPPPAYPPSRREAPTQARVALVITLVIAGLLLVFGGVNGVRSVEGLFWLAPPLVVAAGPVGIFLYWQSRGWPVLVSPYQWPRQALLAASGTGVAASLALFVGNAEIDHAAPHEPTARIAFLATILVTGLGIALTTFLCQKPLGNPAVAAIGLLLGAIYAWPALAMATDYGKEAGRAASGFGIAIFIAAMVVATAVAGLSALMASSVMPRHGAAIFTAHGIGVASGVAMAAAWMLYTFKEQAAEAARINQSTISSVVATLVAVVVAVAVVRRRRLVQ